MYMGFPPSWAIYTCEYAVVIMGSCKSSRCILHICGTCLILHLVSEILRTYVGRHVK